VASSACIDYFHGPPACIEETLYFGVRGGAGPPEGHTAEAEGRRALMYPDTAEAEGRRTDGAPIVRFAPSIADGWGLKQAWQVWEVNSPACGGSTQRRLEGTFCAICWLCCWDAMIIASALVCAADILS